MDAFLDLRTITGLSGGEVERNHQTPGTFAPGQPTMLHAATGLVIVQLVQNRGGADLPRYTLTKLIGAHGVTGVSNFTTQAGDRRGGVTTSGRTANQHVGAIAIITGQGADEPTGEYVLIIGNTATRISFDPRLSLSADLAASGDDLSIISTYQIQISSDSEETAAHAIPGIVVGPDGIDDGNFGFVQCFGLCPFARHDGGALGVNDPIVASQATAGRINENVGGDIAYAVIGISKGPAPDSDTDRGVVHLACGPFATQVTDDTLP